MVLCPVNIFISFTCSPWSSGPPHHSLLGASAFMVLLGVLLSLCLLLRIVCESLFLSSFPKYGLVWGLLLWLFYFVPYLSWVHSACVKDFCIVTCNPRFNMNLSSDFTLVFIVWFWTKELPSPCLCVVFSSTVMRWHPSVRGYLRSPGFTYIWCGVALLQRSREENAGWLEGGSSHKLLTAFCPHEHYGRSSSLESLIVIFDWLITAFL